MALTPCCTEASKLLLQVLVLAQRAWLPCGPETRGLQGGRGGRRRAPTPSAPLHQHHLHSPKWKFTHTAPPPQLPIDAGDNPAAARPHGTTLAPKCFTEHKYLSPRRRRNREDLSKINKRHSNANDNNNSNDDNDNPRIRLLKSKQIMDLCCFVRR